MFQIALSDNHSSVDDQTADALSWLSSNKSTAELSDRFVAEFPEYNGLTWSGSGVDTDASGVDPDYMCWVRDWIEANTSIYWEDGEPYCEID